MEIKEFSYLDALKTDRRLHETIMEITLMEASGLEYDAPDQEHYFIRYYQARVDYEQVQKLIDREKARLKKQKKSLKNRMTNFLKG